MITDDYQFELGGVPFGKPHPIRVESFEMDSAQTRNQDALSDVADYRRFGRDQKTPGTWSWNLRTKASGPAEALALLEQLEAVWDNQSSRLGQGNVVPLKYRLGGRTRMIYGRPRRFTPVISTPLRVGHIPIVADFDRVDLLSYDEQYEATNLTLGAPLTGGFVSPFVFPLSTVPNPQPADDTLYVRGSAATPAIVKFTGALVRPRVVIPSLGWEAGLDYTMAFDETITIDPRSWVQRAHHPDGSPVAALSARTRLRDMLLPPGTYAARFLCDSSFGAVSAQVSWQPASKSV